MFTECSTNIDKGPPNVDIDKMEKYPQPACRLETIQTPFLNSIVFFPL